MGIHRFYRWLKKYNSRALLQYNTLRAPVDILCLDFNGILHKAAQKTYMYGDFNDKYTRLQIYDDFMRSNDAIYKYNALLMHNITQILESIINKVDVRQELYIAVDGIAPESKMIQQRERRYKSAKARNESFIISDPQIFDVASISPGTEIMFLIDEHMKNWCDANKHKYSKITYSSHLTIGEGEHKIFSYLRNNDTLKNVVIHGLDSDLIMLSLISDKNIYLMRDMKYTKNSRRENIEFLSITELKNILDTIMGISNAHIDFVIILFMIGNDFVPHMPGLEDRDTCIDVMINTYTNQNMLLHDEDGIIWNNFAAYVTTLSREESKMLLDGRRNHRYKLKSLENSVSNDTNLNYPKFRRLWYENAYKRKFNNAVVTETLINDMVNDMCANYCSMIAWMFNYYANGIDDINYNMVYDYYHTPLLYDLAHFINNNIALSDNWISPAISSSNTIPILPFHQLLYILHPLSKDLIPEIFKHLMTRGSVLDDYYPEHYAEELQGKSAEYEAVLFLPKIDLRRIIGACRDILKQYDANALDYVFNKYGPINDIIFINTTDVTSMLRNVTISSSAESQRKFSKSKM